MIGQVISHYRVLQRIGGGGMGVVYRAEDLRLSRQVALKFLPGELERDPRALERFRREARAASALDHPHICTIYEIGEHEGRWFIAMQYLEGENLRQRIDRGALPTGELLDLGIQMADALDAAHRKGILHRDIKPANIVIAARGKAKLLDFGLAKMAQSYADAAAAVQETLAEVRSDLTSVGTTLGTLGYMSPEQARGQAIDERADLFSLGAVLYESATGRQPFPGVTAALVFDAILHQAPVPPSRSDAGIPLELERIILKALEKDRALRYQSAAELGSELQRLKRDSAESEGKTTAPVATAAPSASSSGSNERHPDSVVAAGLLRRHRWKVLATVVGLGVIVGALAFGLTRIVRPSSPVDSIAVLPFENLTQEAETEYLSDGLTENLINSLAQLPGLRVVPRSRAFRFKGREIDPQQAARELNVSAVVVGRVLQRGDQLTISAELIDVRRESQLWGEQYNRRLADLVGVQIELTTAIAGSLRRKLTRDQEQALVKHRPASAAAEQLFLKGRYQNDRRSRASLSNAIRLFEEAIAIDPDFAPAHAGLADTLNVLAFFSPVPPEESCPRARAAARRALLLDDTLPLAHTSMGGVHFYCDWDWNAAEASLRTAMQLAPDDPWPLVWNFFFALAMGREEEAVASIGRARALDPLSLMVDSTYGFSFYFAGDPARATAELSRFGELHPDFAPAAYWAGTVNLAQRDFAGATTAFEKARSLEPLNGNYLARLCVAHARAGAGSRAQKCFQELTELATRTYVPPVAFAEYHAAVGDRERYVQALQQANTRRDRWLIFHLRPGRQPMRPTDARVAELIRRMAYPTQR